MTLVRFGSTLCALLLLTACDDTFLEKFPRQTAEASEKTSAVMVRTSAERLAPLQQWRRVTADDHDASDQQGVPKDRRIRNEYVCSVNVWHRECNWGALFSEALGR
jgi:hypothetical protein